MRPKRVIVVVIALLGFSLYDMEDRKVLRKINEKVNIYY